MLRHQKYSNCEQKTNPTKICTNIKLLQNHFLMKFTEMMTKCFAAMGSFIHYVDAFQTSAIAIKFISNYNQKNSL